MIKSLKKLVAYATLLAVTLVGAASPSQAQAQAIGNGHGAVDAPSGPITITFSVVELPNGTINGHGILHFPDLGGHVRFEVTSYTFVDGALLMAGPVTKAKNAPPNYFIGATQVLAVEDNGNGGPLPDKSAGVVGPPSLTIQQIVELIGPPPPQAYQPLQSGNLTIH